MKTLTLVCNFVLLGLGGAIILTDERGPFIGILMVALILFNIVMVAGSAVGVKSALPEESSVSEGNKKNLKFYGIMRIFAVILNILLIVLVSVVFSKGSGYLLPYLFAFIVLSLVLNIVLIAAGRWNRFYLQKRPVFTAGIIVALLFTGTFEVFRILIGNGIRENISIAKNEYPGKAEDALLAYLADSTKSVQDRTKIAVWTLGQIRSEKALPVLQRLYNNSDLNQYEVHKAIVSIESNWMGAREKNVFGSWRKLNK